MSFTKEELQQVKEAWALIEREWPNLQSLNDKRDTSARGWCEGDFQFITSASEKGINVVRVFYDGDENWDSTSISFSTDELLNMDHEIAKYKAVIDVVNAERKRVSEERQEQARREQYERLKAEFEGA